MPSNRLILCHSLLLLPSAFPSIRVFSKSQLFASGGQSIGASALASVLPVNIQDWSPLGWTGWISLQSKGLSRVFSSTTVQKHQFFSAQLYSLYSPTLTMTMFSKSLIQFSAHGWGCVPSLKFGMRPNYGRSNGDNGNLLQKDLCQHAGLPGLL